MFTEREETAPPKFENFRAREIDRHWLGLTFNNFSEIFDLLPARPLTALDVGTGDGRFLHNLIANFPNRFASATGVDISGSGLREEQEGGVPIELHFGKGFDRFATESEQQYDLIFFNSTAIPTSQPEIIESASRLLQRGGAMVTTYHWERFLTGLFNAFDQEIDRINCLASIAASVPRISLEQIWLVSNLDQYPLATYQPIPAPIAYFLKGYAVEEIGATSRVGAIALLTHALGRYDSIFCNDTEQGLDIVMTFAGGAVHTIHQESPGHDHWSHENFCGQTLSGRLCDAIASVRRDIRGL